MFSEKGQSLIELVVVIAVIVIVVGALVFSTIASLRNAQLAKNQSQATKLAQEGIEKVRSMRDRGDLIGGAFQINSQPIDSWLDSDLWTQHIYGNCIPNCYFKFNVSSFTYLAAASSIPSSAEEPLSDGKFKRAIILSDDSVTYQSQKTVTVIVTWIDFSGSHESRLTTFLRKI